MKAVQLVVTPDGRTGTLTSQEGRFVFALFEEKRSDGSVAQGEECHLANEVAIVRMK